MNRHVNHLNDGAFAQIVIAIFDGAAGTDIQTYGSIEFERIAAGGGFAGAEHLAYFLTQLVDEYTCGLGAPVVKCIRKTTKMFFDCHLMVENPEKYIADFKAAGADQIVVHVEATKHLHRCIQQIKNEGMKAGVALCPATPLSSVEEILPYVDMVLIMSVNPGFGGQSFIESSVPKIARLRKMITDAGLDVDIQVDGGINDKTSKLVRAAGANILVAGSFVYGAKDIKAAIDALKE